MTVKELKRKIEELPDDMEVYYERIEDVYFDKYGWQTIPLKDEDGFGKPDIRHFLKVFDAYKWGSSLRITAHY